MLGITQGLTELLPISSSGHLILVPWIADWRYLEAHPDFNKTFDVALHLGTLVAVVAYFWSDVVRYVVAWFGSVRRRAVETADERLAWGVFFATIPAAIAGALGEETIENHLGQPWQIAIFLAVFAGLLWLADRQPQRAGARRPRHRDGIRDRRLADPRADAGRLPLGDHDHDRPVQRPRSRCGRALLVPAADSGRLRRRPLQGREARPARVAAGGLDRSVHRRDARRGRRRARSRSTCCSATCAATTTRRS